MSGPEQGVGGRQGPTPGLGGERMSVVPEPAEVLARSRRSARRRTAGMALGGVVAIAAMAVASQGPAVTPADAVVNVTVGLWGGPAQPTGGMALEGQPAPGVNVTARDTQGKTIEGTTDDQGVAQLHLAPGAYVIFSTYCGPTENASPVTTVQSGDTRSVQIDCAVP